MTQKRTYRLKTAIIFIVILMSVSATQAEMHGKQMSTKTLRNMSRAYMVWGKYQQAHELAAKALKKARSEKVDTGEIAICMIDLGTVCSYEGQLSKASEYLEKGVKLQQRALFDEHPYVAQTLRMLSNVYRRQGEVEKSEAVLTSAVKIMLNNCSIESKEMAPFIVAAGDLKFEKGQIDQALGNYQKALDIYDQNYGSNHLLTANVLEKLAGVYLMKDDAHQASLAMSESLKTKSSIFGRYHPNLIDSWLEMARICKHQGKLERCEYYLGKSTETVLRSNNVIAMARVYEQANQIRNKGLVAMAVTSQPLQ